MNFQFPFGSVLNQVKQTDRSPKKIFILGVYASAVHAKWLSTEGNVLVTALAVASEPYIFWRGDGAEEMIKYIQIPEQAGKLVPADPKFNGPSGKILDECYLKPLQMDRDQVWLADLLPFSRLNPKQSKAIQRKYSPLIEKFHLPCCTIPCLENKDINSEQRREELLNEIFESGCSTIITLGEPPLKYFINKVVNKQKITLSNLKPGEYGEKHEIKLLSKSFELLPLVHPRQAGRLGKSSTKWNELHKNWIFKQQKLQSTF